MSLGLSRARLLGVLVALAACLASPEACLGCFGARPLAMGGAFVAVADDVHATYWNPAGLASLLHAEVGATFDTDWQDLNYDIFAGIAAPVGSRAGVGLLYVFNEDDLGVARREDHYLQAAAGFRLWPWRGGASAVTLSLGAAGKYVARTLEPAGAAGETAHAFDLDLALLLGAGPAVGPRQRMFSFGLLLQNVLESRLNYGLSGRRETFVANVRPALAFRPDPWTILALEVYDATARLDSRPGVRLGLERWLALGTGRPLLALRAGGYHINDKDLRAYTFGLGFSPWAQSEFSYGLLYWAEEGRTTHLLAAGYRF
jgi:hypothetical protein